MKSFKRWRFCFHFFVLERVAAALLTVEIFSRTRGIEGQATATAVTSNAEKVIGLQMMISPFTCF